MHLLCREVPHESNLLPPLQEYQRASEALPTAVSIEQCTTRAGTGRVLVGSVDTVKAGAIVDKLLVVTAYPAILYFPPKFTRPAAM